MPGNTTRCIFNVALLILGIAFFCSAIILINYDLKILGGFLIVIGILAIFTSSFCTVINYQGAFDNLPDQQPGASESNQEDRAEVQDENKKFGTSELNQDQPGVQEEKEPGASEPSQDHPGAQEKNKKHGTSELNRDHPGVQEEKEPGASEPNRDHPGVQKEKEPGASEPSQDHPGTKEEKDPGPSETNQDHSGLHEENEKSGTAERNEVVPSVVQESNKDQQPATSDSNQEEQPGVKEN